MLEVVDMSADIHIYFIFAQERVYTFLHVHPFAFFFRGVCVDRMVSGYDNPVFFGISQHRIQPCQLFVDILFAGIGVFIILFAVFVDQRSRVNPNDTDGCTFFLEYLCVVTVGHCPTAANIGVVQYSLCVTAIFVISQNRKPINHQFRMRIDKFVVGHP